MGAFHLPIQNRSGNMSKFILVTGATGKQGGAVIDALASNSDFTLLAQTRNAAGAGAQKLQSKGNNIKVVEGDQDDVPGLFANAQKVAEKGIWGVYSVQVSQGKGVTHEGESKYQIEHYLKEKAGSMGWTILRPVAFMDNLAPGFPTQVFMAAMRETLGSKPNQWIAVKDIGIFAALAFKNPQQYNHKAIGLAGDELTHQQLSQAFEKKTGQPLV